MSFRSFPDSSILDDLYAGTLDASRWHRGISRIATELHCAGGALLAFDPSDGTLLRDEGYGLEGYREKSELHRKWLAQSPDPRQAPAVKIPPLVPVVEYQLMTMREWHSTAIFNELLNPIDCAYFLCTWLHKSATSFVALSFQADSRRGPFGVSEQKRLKPFLPHIARALEIKDRLEANGLRSASLVEALNSSAAAILILDGRGMLLEASAAAVEMMKVNPEVYCDRAKRLRFHGPSDKKLQERFLAGPRPCEEEGLIHVKRRGRPPLTALPALLPEVPMNWMGSNPAWLIALFDPERSVPPSIPLLSADLGVSLREAQVVALLATGANLGRVATDLGISIETVRKHLKSTFSKTGIRSQSELVRRVITGPAFRLPGVQSQSQSPSKQSVPG